MEDKNPYGWGLSRNLPILIILLVILGFLTANVITLNNIAIAPEDPNQTVSKNSATSLYWFNLIILIFVLIVIILLIMFMYRNKNTPNVDYFGKNITIIGDETRKEIMEQNKKYIGSLEAAAKQKYNEENPQLTAEQKTLCVIGGIDTEPSKICKDSIDNAKKISMFELDTDVKNSCINSGINNPTYCTLIQNSISNEKGFCNRENSTNFGECYDKTILKLGGPPRVLPPPTT